MSKKSKLPCSCPVGDRGMIDVSEPLRIINIMHNFPNHMDKYIISNELMFMTIEYGEKYIIRVPLFHHVKVIKLDNLYKELLFLIEREYKWYAYISELIDYDLKEHEYALFLTVKNNISLA